MIVTVSTLRATAAHIYVPGLGPWWADLDFDSDAPLTGKVTIVLTGTSGAPLELHGTVDPQHSGTFGLTRRVRIVAGAGAWGKPLAPHAYHNDAGVKAITVARDAATEAGETLGTFAPTGRLGADYVREAGPASVALDDARGTTPWWVDFGGVTQVQARPTAAAPSGLAALEFDARSKKAILVLEDPNAISIGTVLTERLDAPETVAAYELHVTPEQARIHAWCGVGRSYLAESFRRAVVRITGATSDKLHGIYSYQVVNMVGDRVALAATAEGLPDIAVADEWSAPGVHGDLTPGSEVLVSFVNGDRGRPVITGFAARGKPGAVPVLLRLGDATSAVARVGDTVTVYFPPLVTGTATIGGTPTAIVLDMANLTSMGLIQSGNPKVLA